MKNGPISMDMIVFIFNRHLMEGSTSRFNSDTLSTSYTPGTMLHNRDLKKDKHHEKINTKTRSSKEVSILHRGLKRVRIFWIEALLALSSSTSAQKTCRL
jgi:hypothetical protein